MSNIIAKIRQRIALKENNKFDLSCTHITTSDFMALSPVYFKEMVPNEKINIKQSTFTRLAPLVKPMFGRCRIENRAFFVPMRTIMKGWNEFITDTPYEGVMLSVPQVKLHDLATILNQNSSAVGSTSTVFDYQTGVDSTGNKYNFTKRGKKIWSILQSLGYRFPIGYYLTNDVTTDDGFVSALPLLAYFKLYDDWYKNQAYADSTFYDLFDNTTGWSTIPANKLSVLFQKVTDVVYDKDYFTSAWDKPTTPNNGVMSSASFFDVTNDTTQTGNSITRSIVNTRPTAAANFPTTPSINGQASNDSRSPHPANLTQYAIDALKSLTDYVKRHQLAGGLAMDRMLARFGVKPSDAALRRSVYIGKNTVEINIADVMATASGENSDSNQSALGEYAGKGVGYNQGAFKYETNEYGFIIVLSSIIPSVGYVQGMNRAILHKNRLDFFTPEFDSLGVQAIARKELLSNYNGGAEGNLISLTAPTALDGVFGFTSRYAEYKIANDNISGDFTCPSMSNGGFSDVWHLNRMLDASTVTTSDLSHSLNFVSASDATQYDRVFAYTQDKYDHFVNIHHFEIEDYAPMAKLFDDYEFDGGNKEVSIEVNGTQLN